MVGTSLFSVLSDISTFVNKSSDLQQIVSGWTCSFQFKEETTPIAWLEVRNGTLYTGAGKFLEPTNVIDFSNLSLESDLHLILTGGLQSGPGNMKTTGAREDFTRFSTIVEKVLPLLSITRIPPSLVKTPSIAEIVQDVENLQSPINIIKPARFPDKTQALEKERSMILEDLTHKVFVWEVKDDLLLEDVNQDLLKLVKYGTILRQILTPGEILPEELRNVGEILEHIEGLAILVRDKIAQFGGKIEMLVQVCQAAADVLGEQEYVVGMRGFWSEDGTLERISNRDLVKKKVYYFRESGFEIFSFLKPYLVDAEQDSSPLKLGGISHLINHFIEVLTQVFKGNFDSFLILGQTPLLARWSETLGALEEWVRPLAYLHQVAYFSSQVTIAKDAFVQISTDKEIKLGSKLKLDRFWAKKKDVRALLDLADTIHALL